MAVSEAQELFLRMLEMTSFNNLEGQRVARDLRSHCELWRACVFTRQGALALLVLRDLPEDIIAYDTLFILAAPSHQDQLQRVVEGWEADEVSWIGFDEARRMLGGRRAVEGLEGDPERTILRVWWD
jgi:hypothetical protein